MKQIMLSLIAVVCLAGFTSLSYADDKRKPDTEVKDEMKGQKDEMKANHDDMKSEMKGQKDEMKVKHDDMKSDMKGKTGEMGK
jgi:hypothetical protein